MSDIQPTPDALQQQIVSMLSMLGKLHTLDEFEEKVTSALEAVLDLEENEWGDLGRLTEKSRRALVVFARLSDDELRVARGLLETMLGGRSLLNFKRRGGTDDEAQQAWREAWEQAAQRFDAVMQWIAPKPQPEVW
jgi:hypothetical protein